MYLSITPDGTDGIEVGCYVHCDILVQLIRLKIFFKAYIFLYSTHICNTTRYKCSYKMKIIADIIQ